MPTIFIRNIIVASNHSERLKWQGSKPFDFRTIVEISRFRLSERFSKHFYENVIFRFGRCRLGFFFDFRLGLSLQESSCSSLGRVCTNALLNYARAFQNPQERLGSGRDGCRYKTIRIKNNKLFFEMSSPKVFIEKT